jgi:hypothetical protein
VHPPKKDYARLRADKAIWLLDRLTPRELQHSTAVSVPTKTRSNAILPINHILFSTGIPASTIKRFQDGTAVPRAKSIKKLSDFYDKYAYQLLRSLGANKENARKLSRSQHPLDMEATRHRYIRWAKQIQKNHAKLGRPVALINIQWGMAHSQHGTNDWDKLAMTSGLQKYRHYKDEKKGSTKVLKKGTPKGTKKVLKKDRRGRYQH